MRTVIECVRVTRKGTRGRGGEHLQGEDLALVVRENAELAVAGGSEGCGYELHLVTYVIKERGTVHVCNY